MTAKHCVKCDALLSDGDMFCRTCGCEVEGCGSAEFFGPVEGGLEASNDISQERQEDCTDKKKDGKQAGCFRFAVVLVVVLVLAGVFGGGSEQPAKNLEPDVSSASSSIEVKRGDSLKSALVQTFDFSEEEADAAYEILDNVGCGDMVLSEKNFKSDTALQYVQGTIGGFDVFFTAEDKSIFLVAVRDASKKEIDLYNKDVRPDNPYINYFDFPNKSVRRYSEK